MLRKFLLSFCLTLAVSSLVFAASTERKILFGTAAGGKVAVTSDTTGTAYCTFGQNDHALILWLDSKFNSGTSTLDAKVQYSVDGGVNWKDLYAFDQQTTSDLQKAIHIPDGTTHLAKCLRAVLDVGAAGSPNYSVYVAAFYSRGAY